MSGTPAKIHEIFEHISDALSQTETDLRTYIKNQPDFAEVGTRMLEEWKKGSQLSLQTSGSRLNIRDGDRGMRPA